VHHSLTFIKIPNFVEIGETFLSTDRLKDVPTDGRTFPHLMLGLLGRLGGADLKSLEKNLKRAGTITSIKLLQKAALLRTVRILRKVLDTG